MGKEFVKKNPHLRREQSLFSVRWTFKIIVAVKISFRKWISGQSAGEAVKDAWSLSCDLEIWNQHHTTLDFSWLAPFTKLWLFGVVKEV